MYMYPALTIHADSIFDKAFNLFFNVSGTEKSHEILFSTFRAPSWKNIKETICMGG